MKLENQVVSLELAKKLKKLGVKQSSIFYWLPHYNSTADTFFDINYEGQGWLLGGKIKKEIVLKEDKHNNTFSAFTSVELGKMLPTRNKNFEYDLRIDRFFINLLTQFCINYYDSYNNKYLIKTDFTYDGIIDETQVNAMAKMLCYLIENKLIN